MDTASVAKKETAIAPTAIIAESAQLGKNVQIGPYAIVEAHTVIGDNCVLGAHAIVKRFAKLGDAVFVDSFAVVGGDNQDRKFDPRITSGVMIGAHTQIREGATIQRASHEGEYTLVGEGCLIMGNAHIAHDCILGNNVILANNALLAGHIEAHDNCILSGNTAFHQFIRIGQYSMTSGCTAIAFDIPPFVLCAERNTLHGLNIVGIRRAGFTNTDVKDLKNLYRHILATRGNPEKLAHNIRQEGIHGRSNAGKIFLDFFDGTSNRGYLHAY